MPVRFISGIFILKNLSHANVLVLLGESCTDDPIVTIGAVLGLSRKLRVSGLRRVLSKLRRSGLSN